MFTGKRRRTTLQMRDNATPDPLHKLQDLRASRLARPAA
jgi:hypothetical protein